MAERILNYKFLINSLEVNAGYYESDIKNIFIPMLKRLSKIAEHTDERVIVYLSAPPGCGKSTLASFLECLSAEDESMENIQSLGIDGFHYCQSYIKKHSVDINGRQVPMSEIKGSPETFDRGKLISRIESLKSRDITWPIYDRKLHDIIEDKIFVSKHIVLIEGNWLLLKEKDWSDLRKYCDYSIFIKADVSMLETRLVQRKIKGGMSKKDAASFYKRSDEKNIKRVLDNSSEADFKLELLNNGKYIIADRECNL